MINPGRSSLSGGAGASALVDMAAFAGVADAGGAALAAAGD